MLCLVCHHRRNGKFIAHEKVPSIQQMVHRFHEHHQPPNITSSALRILPRYYSFRCFKFFFQTSSLTFSFDISQQFQSRPDESPSHEYNFKIESHTAFLDALKTALRTSAHSFVLRFVEINGLPALLEILRSLDIRVANSPMHSSLIQCLKALMNNSVRHFA